MSKDLFKGTDKPEAGDQTLDDNFQFDFQDDLAQDDGENMGLSDDDGEDIESSFVDGEDEDETGIRDAHEENQLDEEDFPSLKHNEDELEEEEEEEFEEEEIDDSKLDLDSVNKTLGTDFKDIESLKKHFEKENKKEETPIVTEEENKKYEVNSSAINYLKGLLQKDDSDIIREKLRSDYMAKNNVQELSEEEESEIEFKIEKLKDNGTEMVVANNIKNDIEKNISKRSEFNKDIDKRKSDYETKSISERRQELQSEFKDIYKGGSFFGTEPTQEDIQKAYESIVSGEFFKKVEKDTTLTAKHALMLQMEGKISKKASKKSFSDGVKKVFDEAEKNSRRGSNRRKASQASSRGTRGSDLNNSLVSAWTQ